MYSKSGLSAVHCQLVTRFEKLCISPGFVSFHVKTSNVEESFLLHLGISPVQTSQAHIPTTSTAPGLLWWQRVPLCSLHFTTLSWNTTPAVLTTTSKSIMAYPRMRETSLGHFVVTSLHLSSPRRGMSCPLSFIQTAM